MACETNSRDTASCGTQTGTSTPLKRTATNDDDYPRGGKRPNRCALAVDGKDNLQSLYFSAIHTQPVTLDHFPHSLYGRGLVPTPFGSPPPPGYDAIININSAQLPYFFPQLLPYHYQLPYPTLQPAPTAGEGNQTEWSHWE